MVFLITASLLGSVHFIVTTVQLRVPGLTWFRRPFFVWAQFVTAFLLLLAFLTAFHDCLATWTGTHDFT